MKNIFAIFVSGILLFAVLGCGISDRIQNAVSEQQTNTSSTNSSNSANKTTADQVTEDVLREKTGIPECDEVLDMLADQSKSPDENFVSKAAKELVFNQIRQSLKESIQQNQNDKEKLAQSCKEFKVQLEKYQTEPNSNQ